MKKLSVLLLVFVGFFEPVAAQSPQLIPYQAIARNAAGSLIQNQTVSLRFTIHDITSGGTTLYQETQTINTNNLGLFNVSLGNGTPIGSYVFSNVAWGNGNPKFIQVEIDPAGGTAYTNLGSVQMMSVPYALYAGTAISATGSLTSLNGLTATSQTFANGSTGTALAFSSVGSINTLNIPVASAASVTAGLLANTAYTTFSNKISGTSTQNKAPHWTGTNAGTGTLSTSGLIADNGTSVDIGNTDAAGAAILDLTNTTNLGFLPPAMAARPTSPAAGLVIYNTTNGCLEFFSSGQWQQLGCPCTSGPSTAAGAISGSGTSLCTGSANTFSITAIPGATTYTWSAPSTSNIVVAGTSYGTSYSGPSPSISLTMGTAAGTLSVTDGNSCGTNSTPATLAITLPATLGQPSIAPTSQTVCPNTGGYIFTVTPAGGTTPTTYTWTSPANTVITVSGTSYGTSYTGSSTSISLATTAGFSSGSVSVTANNCAGVASSPVNCVLSLPAAPTISGPTNVGAAGSGTYSVNVPGATAYSWSVSGGGASTSGSVNNQSVLVTWGGALGTPAGTTTTVNVSVTVCGTQYTGSLANIQAGGHTTYAYSGNTQTWGGSNYNVTTAQVKVWGGGGGGGGNANGWGGPGGCVFGTLTVTPGLTYTVIVGQGGQYVGVSTGGTGGWSGAGLMTAGTGGAGGSLTNESGGGGGGRSAIQATISSVNYELVVAGGGGGGGGYGSGAGDGGVGGGGTSSSGHGAAGGNGTGATPGNGGGINGVGTGGAAVGGGGAIGSGTGGNTNETGGAGGGTTSYAGGGGGGGYWAGGGGGSNGSGGGGGGGGSCYYNSTYISGTVYAGTIGNGGTADTAPESTDSDYTGTIGKGGAAKASGSNGYIVILW